MLRDSTRSWWGSGSSPIMGSTQNTSKQNNGLNSSKWATASENRNSATFLACPAGDVASIDQESDIVDNQATHGDCDFEMDQEFSFSTGHKYVSQMSASTNAVRPEMPRHSMEGVHNGFNTPEAEFGSANLRGVPPQSQSIVQDQLLGTPISFSLDIAMDDDGDVVMMDLSDPGTIMLVDKIARIERETGTIGGYADLKSGLRPTVSSSRINNPSCVFVIDTNFILSHLQLVNNLVRSHPRWRNVIIMPWATIQELDGLKKSNRQNGGVDVAKLARNAIRWAYDAFERHDPGVWAQIKEEKCDNSATRGDPAILDCCVYFQCQGHSTVLLSHDKNLCLQAMSYNISIMGNGITKTAEEILSRFLHNLPNPKVEPVSDIRSAAPSAEYTNPTYTPAPYMLLPPPLSSPLMRSSTPNSTLFASYDTVSTNSPTPNYASSTYRSANADRQKIQPPFYPTLSVNVPYTQYGVKSTAIPLPNTSGGLQDSVYAPRNKATAPKPRKYAVPIANPTFGQTEFPLPSNITAQDISCLSGVDIKLGLRNLLQEISSSLITNLVPLLKKCTLEKLGGMETLQHLNIFPEKQVHSILDMEKFFYTHWMTVFTEIFPENLHQVFGNAELNQRYARWIYWTQFSGPNAAGPKKWEIRKWIEEWDFVWKRLVYTENEAMANMDIVDGWRTTLTGVGLSD